MKVRLVVSPNGIAVRDGAVLTPGSCVWVTGFAVMAHRVGRRTFAVMMHSNRHIVCVYDITELGEHYIEPYGDSYTYVERDELARKFFRVITVDSLEQSITILAMNQGAAIDWEIEPFPYLSQARLPWPAHDEFVSDGTWHVKPSPLRMNGNRSAVRGTEDASYILFLIHRSDGTIQELTVWFEEGCTSDELRAHLQPKR